MLHLGPLGALEDLRLDLLELLVDHLERLGEGGDHRREDPGEERRHRRVRPGQAVGGHGVELVERSEGLLAHGQHAVGEDVGVELDEVGVDVLLGAVDDDHHVARVLRHPGPLAELGGVAQDLGVQVEQLGQELDVVLVGVDDVEPVAVGAGPGGLDLGPVRVPHAAVADGQGRALEHRVAVVPDGRRASAHRRTSLVDRVGA